MSGKFLKLKSGTDIRGVAVQTETERIELTDDTVYRICRSYAEWYQKKYHKKNFAVAIGHDSRISALRIKNAAIKGFGDSGVTVYDCSMCSTPAMFMSIVFNDNIDCALEITASHHPYQRNGLKFFTEDGGLDGSDIESILLGAEQQFTPPDGSAECCSYDLMRDYCAHLKDMIVREAELGDQPLKNLHITVDAGNGAGGFFATDILEPLGADISGSRFLEPDGMFPNHIPNPENQDAVRAACRMVLESRSDFGFIFDTDVDRMGCIGSDGAEINRNRLVALASAIALEGAAGTVVTDSLTSDGLREFIEKKLGGKQLRYQRGYKNVIDKAKELNEKGIFSPLAIETSGHAALKENYFLDDGAYLAAKIVILLAKLSKSGKRVEDLIADLKEPAESAEIRIPILQKDFKEYGCRVIDCLRDYAVSRDGWEIEQENYEGVRINVSGGWFLLRLSVHDPILPLNIENDAPGVCGQIAEELKTFFSQFDSLDLSNFS